MLKDRAVVLSLRSNEPQGLSESDSGGLTVLFFGHNDLSADKAWYSLCTKTV